MINYYQILEIHESSNNEEIKNSFRKLVKKYHPDKNKTNGSHSEEKIKLLIKAYKTLTDTDQKTYYDRILQGNNYENYYYNAGSNNSSSLSLQTKAILNDLLNCLGAQAVKNYERLKQENEGFDLMTFLDLKDYLDCTFLLAEEYEKQRNYELAFKLYIDVYQEEDVNPSRRYLVEEIKDRIVRISCKKLTKQVQTKSAIAYLKRVLKFNLSKVEKAFIYKKIADCYTTSGEWNKSMVNFNKAMSLYPNLKGTQTLRNKLNKHFPQMA